MAGTSGSRGGVPRRERKKIFNDSVHGNMEFHPLCVAIIDTPEFQRLRDLKQLGVTYYVYPGASHNRFEHSLGVCYLAGQLVRRLQANQPELGITEEDVLCVEIAGLCHDLGHGPFSHVFDKKFIPKAVKTAKDAEPTGTKWKHEKASILLFDELVKKEELKRLFDNDGIDDKRRQFIKELIMGKDPKEETEKESFYPSHSKKAFLYEIVANKRNEVDVDKMDYFKRDALHLGMTSGFDHLRFITFARVIKVDDKWQICVRDKEAFNMYQLFHTRYALHRRAYQHKTVQAVEISLVQAMMKANEVFQFLDSTNAMNRYVRLTDSIFHEILRRDDEGLRTAQGHLRDIQTRNIHRCVGETSPITNADTKKKTEDKIKSQILEILRKTEPDEVKKLDSFRFAVQIARLDFGGGEKNPVDKFRFYTKDNENKAVCLTAAEVSFMIPQNLFEEHLVRLFLKPSDQKPEEDERVCDLLGRAFGQWCQDNGNLSFKTFAIKRENAGRAGDSIPCESDAAAPSQRAPKRQGKTTTSDTAKKSR